MIVEYLAIFQETSIVFIASSMIAMALMILIVAFVYKAQSIK